MIFFQSCKLNCRMWLTVLYLIQYFLELVCRDKAKQIWYFMIGNRYTCLLVSRKCMVRVSEPENFLFKSIIYLHELFWLLIWTMILEMNKINQFFLSAGFHWKQHFSKTQWQFFKNYSIFSLSENANVCITFPLILRHNST